MVTKLHKESYAIKLNMLKMSFNYQNVGKLLFHFFSDLLTFYAPSPGMSEWFRIWCYVPCGAHFMCHYVLSPTSESHPFSILLSQAEWFLYVLLEENITRKYHPYIWTCIPKFCFSGLLSLYSVLPLLCMLIFFCLGCYYSMWLYFSLIKCYLVRCFVVSNNVLFFIQF